MLVGAMLVLSACDAQRQEPEGNDAETQEVQLALSINGTPVTVEWEDNESVVALRDLAEDKLTIRMSPYGGFEQVGSLGSTLPSNDVQMTTEPGDIVLYSSSQIVLFYGSNSWAYTRLGRITDRTAGELERLFEGEDISITLEMK